MSDFFELYDWLNVHPLAQQPHTNHTVHGDYRFDNVVFDDNGAVKAVLDWELIVLNGDAWADVFYSGVSLFAPFEPFNAELVDKKALLISFDVYLTA